MSFLEFSLLKQLFEPGTGQRSPFSFTSTVSSCLHILSRYVNTWLDPSADVSARSGRRARGYGQNLSPSCRGSSYLILL